MLVLDVGGERFVCFCGGVVHETAVKDCPAAVKVGDALDDAARDGDVGLFGVDVGDDGADEGLVDVGHVLCEEGHGGFDVVEVDAEVHDGEAAVFFVGGFFLFKVFTFEGGFFRCKRGLWWEVGCVGEVAGLEHGETGLLVLLLVIDGGVAHEAVVVGDDNFFELIVEVGHDFGEAVVGVGGEHHVGDNVNVAFVDPAKGTLDAAVEVVDFETVNAEAIKFLPRFGFSYTHESALLVVGDDAVDLARVDGEEGAVKGAGHVARGEEVVEEPLFA